jgi:hypothetical protein
MTMPIAFEGNEELGHLILGQMLANTVNFVRLSSLRCHWSLFTANDRLEVR